MLCRAQTRLPGRVILITILMITISIMIKHPVWKVKKEVVVRMVALDVYDIVVVQLYKIYYVDVVVIVAVGVCAVHPRCGGKLQWYCHPSLPTRHLY